MVVLLGSGGRQSERPVFGSCWRVPVVDAWPTEGKGPRSTGGRKSWGTDGVGWPVSRTEEGLSEGEGRGGEVDWACVDDRSNWRSANGGARWRTAKTGEELTWRQKQGRGMDVEERERAGWGVEFWVWGFFGIFVSVMSVPLVFFSSSFFFQMFLFYWIYFILFSVIITIYKHTSKLKLILWLN